MIKYVQAMVLINKNKLLPNQNRINEAVDEKVLNNNSQSQLNKNIENIHQQLTRIDEIMWNKTNQSSKNNAKR
jgi:hypothetical protein